MTKAEKKKCVEHDAYLFDSTWHLLDSATCELFNVIESAKNHATLRDGATTQVFEWIDLLAAISRGCQMYAKQCKNGRIYQ
jgi:hypothetical protein